MLEVLFGGGAHTYFGLHLATMQVRIFMALLLRRYRVAPATGDAVIWQPIPIPQPKGGLPVRLTPRSATPVPASQTLREYRSFLI